ncbi:MAG: 2-oxoacid:acceptor oxidoreductase subunit alpha [Chloroflexi bacterium]|nr:2-oxoacid:acceptor oxidoreductase subunit alpha [Chloroflexota bacterium]
MTRNDLVIRVAGEAGEGIVSTGQLLTQAALRGGFHVLTYSQPPSEIKGGHAFYQIRLNAYRSYSKGDSVDILLAFNQEAYDRNAAETKDDGLLVYDPSEVTPSADSHFVQVEFPLNDIAKNQLKFPIAKNVVAVGALAELFGLPTKHLDSLIEERWLRKGEAVVQKNLDALRAGIDYVIANVPQRENFALYPEKSHAGEIMVSGSEAIGLGAIAAGCGFMAGYPITPASDIKEFLEVHLPKTGGHALQAEDELAAIGMVLGASFAGSKAMTATSGPGFSLMIEMLGLAAMAELPCVIVDAQRAGPSTGMPTRHEQGDLYQAAFAGHGECPRIVLAPTSVRDCFYQTVNAFNLAEKYQTPVILLGDTLLNVRSESIPRPDLNEVAVIDRLLFSENGNGVGVVDEGGSMNGEYHRYVLTENGVSPMAVPGQAGGQYIATGLEHNEEGLHRYDEATHTIMTQKRFRKLERAALEAPEADRFGDPSAEIGILTWGSTVGSVIEVIRQAEEEGLKLDMLAPRMLMPLPDHELRPFIESKRVIIVPEVNYVGQFANMVTSQYPRDYVRINIFGGMPFRVDWLLEQIREEVAQHV